ncbi:MAG: hypothetical protein IH891_02815 [Planctomycetes bacterium]|nr:hypothetical protein [Planctomycetota bacterium]
MNDVANKSSIVPGNRRLPPPRPGVRHVTLPLIRMIVIADDDLRTSINRHFHWPMLMLALLMLPLLVVEFLIKPAPGTWLRWVCLIGLTIIWLAFFIEFVVKITIAESRFEYAKRNWLDIIIIIMPAFRTLRFASIARSSRLFTLRGVGMKFGRYFFTGLLGLEATDRLLLRIGLKKKHRRPHPDKMTRHQLSTEVLKLRKLEDAWEAWYEEHMEHLTERGIELYEVIPPGFEDQDDDDSVVEEIVDESSGAKGEDEPTIPPSCESPSPN